MTAVPATLVTAAALAGVLLCEWRGLPKLGGAAKLTASAGFIAVAGSFAAEPWHWVMLAGFGLSFIGDGLLIARSHPPMFLGGLVAFLFAHVAYAIAFIMGGVNWAWATLAGMVSLAPLLMSAKWLRPHVPLAMQRPVAAYMLVISAMFVLAIATMPVQANMLIPAGAALFYVSDLAVARQRFVEASIVNRLWGLPAYYAGQLLLAWSLGTAHLPSA